MAPQVIRRLSPLVRSRLSRRFCLLQSWPGAFADQAPDPSQGIISCWLVSSCRCCLFHRGPFPGDPDRTVGRRAGAPGDHRAGSGLRLHRPNGAGRAGRWRPLGGCEHGDWRCGRHDRCAHDYRRCLASLCESCGGAGRSPGKLTAAWQRLHSSDTRCCRGYESNWHRMPFLSCDRSAQKPLPVADDSGVGGDRDSAAHFLDTVEAARRVVVPASSVNLFQWLQPLFGPVVAPSGRRAGGQD